jgi:hypothetical protein
MRNVTETTGRAIRRSKPATPTAAAPLPEPIVQVRMVVVGRNNSTAEVAPANLTFRQAAGKLDP